MTTAELVKALAERMGVTQKQARTLLDGYVAAITHQLAAKNSVILRGFGTFSVKEVPEKRAYVPSEESLCTIPAHDRLHFKPAKSLKDEASEAHPDE
ncbi:MAG: HU family DNA-binding protein [Chromatiales bacterium]|nr:HU family DNA-binding protein [Chromatiales bacterium]